MGLKWFPCVQAGRLCEHFGEYKTLNRIPFYSKENPRISKDVSATFVTGIKVTADLKILYQQAIVCD